jgi:lipopolysaccharide export system permease protein
MDRYIASQLFLPFLFGVGAFSSVGVAIGTLFDLVRKITEAGLPLEIAAQVLLLKVPEFVNYALPMSTLLAALMTYSRFSSDSEIIALRSCGISVYRLAIPAIILSLLVTGISFLFNELVVPAANYQAGLTLQTALKQEKRITTETNIFYPEYKEITGNNGDKKRVLSRLFYADEFDGKQMKGLTILDWSQEKMNQIISADSGTWNREENIWDFFKGTIYLINSKASYRNIIKFEHHTFKLPRTPIDLVSKHRDYTEMNIGQTYEYLQTILLSGDEKKILKVQVRLNQRIAFPFVCLVFGLAGATLGIQPQRKGKAMSFGIIIIISFGYYLLGFMTNALGLVGILSPIMSAWLPNVIGLATVGFLVIKTNH